MAQARESSWQAGLHIQEEALGNIH